MQKTKVISVRKLSWLDHAQKHHSKAHRVRSDKNAWRKKEYIEVKNPTYETLMYLSLFAYFGMFDN
jgi:hypothetical protein